MELNALVKELQKLAETYGDWNIEGFFIKERFTPASVRIDRGERINVVSFMNNIYYVKFSKKQ